MPKSKKKQRKLVQQRSAARLRPLHRFVPSLLAVGLSLTIHLQAAWPALSGRTDTLAYAVSMQADDLLASTNMQRQNYGAGQLVIDAKLSAAAQAKAEDMISRDYWSHIAPDGKQPWEFIVAAGYQYRAAGENLAYGFRTSHDAVIGWMNSPPHKENLLKPDYRDVGFGIANSRDYVGNGNMTIVVAMYGLALNAPPVTAAVAPTAVRQDTVTAEPLPAVPLPPVPVAAAQGGTIDRLQLLSQAMAPWSSAAAALMIGAAAFIWGLQRGWHVKKLVIEGERLFMRHLHIDALVISLLLLLWVLSRTAGTIL